MSLNINRYLQRLRKEANVLERIDINGKEYKSFYSRLLAKTIFSIISLLLIVLSRNGLSDAFISYTANVLSILVGLFITSLIFGLDKFYQAPRPSNTENPSPSLSSREKLWDTQAYNYTKQFAYITGYNIVLCIFALTLIMICALFKSIQEFKLNELFFTTITEDSTILFIMVCLVIIIRFLIFYWIQRIMYNTLFIVSSMVNFMISKIDRVND